MESLIALLRLSCKGGIEFNMKKLRIILFISIVFMVILGSCTFAANTVSSKKSTNNVSASVDNNTSQDENTLEVEQTKEENVLANNSENTKTENVSEKQDNNKGIAMIAAALSTGLACIGAGIAVALVASSAVGAISENPNLLGKTIIFAGLAEGIAIYGLIISIMILNQA